MKKIHLIALFTFTFTFLSFLCEAQLTDLHLFGSSISTGWGPDGSVILSGNKLYGMTSSGGAKDSGVIFSIDTSGSNYKDIWDFTGKTGWYGAGDLVLYEGRLYGMVPGGANGDGCIFSLDTNGSGYKVLFNFNGTSGSGEALSLTPANGKLYGMTTGGGLYGDGVIFSLDTNGNNYKDMFDFNSANGMTPLGSLTLSGKKLFGMTKYGGIGAGVIFSIDTDGSFYKTLFKFNSTNAANPYGSLTQANGKLYGMAPFGGTFSRGCIFSLDSNGSNFKTLWTFDSGSMGENGYGDLILSGSILYGATYNGGLNSSCHSCPISAGNIFSIDTNGSSYTDLYDFPVLGGNGENPFMGPLAFSGTVLYGMTCRGGPLNAGVIFGYGIDNITTSINKLSQGSIKVYPNPSNGQFTIQSSVVSGQSAVEIYNVLGEKVYSFSYPLNTNHYSLDLCSKPAGVYFYRVLNNDGSVMGEGKLVIQK